MPSLPPGCEAGAPTATAAMASSIRRLSKQDLKAIPMGSSWHGVKKPGLLLKPSEQWSASALCVQNGLPQKQEVIKRRLNKDVLVLSGWHCSEARVHFQQSSVSL